MNVLILGINGFLGSAISRRAIARGHRVFGLSRSDSAKVDQAVTYLVGDRARPDAIAGVVDRNKIDVLVDVIAMTLEDTQPLITYVDRKIAQYVMLSSSDVYRNYELFQGKATGSPNIESVNENSELRATRFPYRGQVPRKQGSPDRYLDDYDKIPIEAATRQMSSNWTILRLPMVYGPGDKQRRFRWAIKPMSNGAADILLPKAWLDWHSTYGYIDNVAEGVALTLGNQKAMNRVFNIGEQPSISHLDWATRIADVLGWKGSITHGEDPNSPFVQGLTGLNLNVPFKLSSTRIRRDLGFNEIVSETQRLSRTIDAELGMKKI